MDLKHYWLIPLCIRTDAISMYVIISSTCIIIITSSSNGSNSCSVYCMCMFMNYHFVKCFELVQLLFCVLGCGRRISVLSETKGQFCYYLILNIVLVDSHTVIIFPAI